MWENWGWKWEKNLGWDNKCLFLRLSPARIPRRYHAVSININEEGEKKGKEGWSNLQRCLNLELSWLSYRFNSRSWHEKNNVIRAYINGRYPRETLSEEEDIRPSDTRRLTPQGKTIIFLQCTSLAQCVRSEARREDYHSSFRDFKIPRVLREEKRR